MCRRAFMEKDQLDKFSAFVDTNKGKRKFTQSIELAVNFTGLDFSKQDNRLNMEIKLPNSTGRVRGVIVFANNSKVVEAATQVGAKLIGTNDLASVTTNKQQMADLLNYELFAEPSMMPQIAKVLGPFLGPRNKMPRPLLDSDVAKVIRESSRSISIRSKGKYLPTVHCVVGAENMSTSELAANVDEVVGALVRKVGRPHIKSVFVKMTMSAPLRLM
jgi:large subunit ribosomal protein L1